MLSTTFIPYAHMVFTVPHLLTPLALQNKKLIYTLLLRLSAATLMEVASSPKHLGAEIGFFSVLHSWTQKMEHHPHAHCVVPAGRLSFKHRRWVVVNPRYRFFLPRKVLGLVFRGSHHRFALVSITQNANKPTGVSACTEFVNEAPEEA